MSSVENQIISDMLHQSQSFHQCWGNSLPTLHHLFDTEKMKTSTDSTVTFEIHQVSDVAEVTSSIHFQKEKSRILIPPSKTAGIQPQETQNFSLGSSEKNPSSTKP